MLKSRICTQNSVLIQLGVQLTSFFGGHVHFHSSQMNPIISVANSILWVEHNPVQRHWSQVIKCIRHSYTTHTHTYIQSKPVKDLTKQFQLAQDLYILELRFFSTLCDITVPCKYTKRSTTLLLLLLLQQHIIIWPPLYQLACKTFFRDFGIVGGAGH